MFTKRSAFVWLAFLALPVWCQSRVQGVVYERATQGARPLARAFVSLSTSGGELIGTARTDAQGRYHFRELPAGRLELAASKPGYLARQAAGRAGSKAILDCSAGCRESSLDFELSRGAVLPGVVLESAHEPVRGATVSLRRGGAAASVEESAKASTDDRGRFRLAGLPGGSYTLTVRRRGPAGQDEVLTRTVEIRDGEQAADLVLSLGSQGSFRVAGRVSGIPYSDGYRTWVALRPINSSARSIQADVGPDGRFRFDSVPAGRYRASAAVVKLDAVQRSDHFLETVEVLGDTDSITLQRVEPAAVIGTVEVAAGALPAGAIIRFTSQEGSGYNWTKISGSGRPFELDGLRPGAYRVEAGSAQFYVKGVKGGADMRNSGELVLLPGLNRLTIVVAADHGQVSGLVRDPATRRPLPHARVALRGERGDLSAQADQAGRFLFGKVIPGDYRICAWSSLAPELIEDEANWERAGCRSRIIPIAPSSQIEIEVRAAP